jgi:hypothetical protein
VHARFHPQPRESFVVYLARAGKLRDRIFYNIPRVAFEPQALAYLEFAARPLSQQRVSVVYRAFLFFRNIHCLFASWPVCQLAGSELANRQTG